MEKDVNNRNRNSLYRTHMGMNPPSECNVQKKPVAEKFRIEDYIDDKETSDVFTKRNRWNKQRIINYGLSSDEPYRTIEWSEIIGFYEEYKFVFFKGIFPRKWYEKKRPYSRDPSEKRFRNVSIRYMKRKIPAVAGFFDKKFYVPISFLDEINTSITEFANHYKRNEFTVYDFAKEGIYFDSHGIHPVMKNDDLNAIKRPGARTPVKKWH